MKLRFVIDVSNVINPTGANGMRAVKLSRLGTLIVGLRDEFGQGTPIVCVIDASMSVAIERGHPDAAELTAMLRDGSVVQAPGKADPFLLEMGRKSDYVVVSNDQYRDHEAAGTVRLPFMIAGDQAYFIRADVERVQQFVGAANGRPRQPFSQPAAVAKPPLEAPPPRSSLERPATVQPTTVQSTNRGFSKSMVSPKIAEAPDEARRGPVPDEQARPAETPVEPVPQPTPPRPPDPARIEADESRDSSNAALAPRGPGAFRPDEARGLPGLAGSPTVAAAAPIGKKGGSPPLADNTARDVVPVVPSGPPLPREVKTEPPSSLEHPGPAGPGVRSIDPAMPAEPQPASPGHDPAATIPAPVGTARSSVAADTPPGIGRPEAELALVAHIERFIDGRKEPLDLKALKSLLATDRTAMKDVERAFPVRDPYWLTNFVAAHPEAFVLSSTPRGETVRRSTVRSSTASLPVPRIPAARAPTPSLTAAITAVAIDPAAPRDRDLAGVIAETVAAHGGRIALAALGQLLLNAPASRSLVDAECPKRPAGWLKRVVAARADLFLLDGDTSSSGNEVVRLLDGDRETATPLAQTAASVVTASVAGVIRSTGALGSVGIQMFGKERDPFGEAAQFAVGGVRHRVRRIPAGRFLMGSPEDEPGRYGFEGPVREVDVSQGFWLGETPVTQAFWRAVMGDNPSRFENHEHPVEQVSWADCEAFLVRLNALLPGLDARFPTEAEWEYACRGGSSGTDWWKGGPGSEDVDSTIGRVAWYRGNCDGGPRPVGLKEPNPLGLFDMLGNVYEWCGDWFGPYSPASVADPRGPDTGVIRVIRGGAWDTGPRYIRAARRFAQAPGDRVPNIGLRLVCDARP